MTERETQSLGSSARGSESSAGLFWSGGNEESDATRAASSRTLLRRLMLQTLAAKRDLGPNGFTIPSPLQSIGL